MATLMATKKTKKPAQKPMVRIIDGERGLYTVPSQTYGGYLLYLVDAINGRCECEGNAVWGKECRHIKAARIAYAARAFMAQAVPVPAPAVRPDLVARYGGAAALMDAFGL